MDKKPKEPPNEIRYTLKPLSTEEALKKAMQAKPAGKGGKAKRPLPSDS